MHRLAGPRQLGQLSGSHQLRKTLLAGKWAGIMSREFAGQREFTLAHKWKRRILKHGAVQGKCQTEVPGHLPCASSSGQQLENTGQRSSCTAERRVHSVHHHPNGLSTVPNGNLKKNSVRTIIPATRGWGQPELHRQTCSHKEKKKNSQNRSKGLLKIN